jgi:hypothetical protein
MNETTSECGDRFRNRAISSHDGANKSLIKSVHKYQRITEPYSAMEKVNSESRISNCGFAGWLSPAVNWKVGDADGDFDVDTVGLRDRDSICLLVGEGNREIV